MENFSTFRELLQEISDLGFSYYLAGGQAINLWSELYEEVEPSLTDHKPYTSKDADIVLVGSNAIQKLKSLGDLTVAENPLGGQCAILRTGSNPQLELDILQDLYGLGKEREKIVARLGVVRDISVIDPVFLLKSKLKNLAGLNQDCRQDAKHVKMAILIVRAHLNGSLSVVEKQEITERDFIREVKLVQSLVKCRKLKEAFVTVGREVTDAMPIDAFSEYLERKRGGKLADFLSQQKLVNTDSTLTCRVPEDC